MIRVLLVSPLDPKKPGNLKFLVGGENTYTRTLLANSPKGVIYIHHLDALSRGLVEYTVVQGLLSIFVKFRILPLSSGSQCLKIKGDFDLVHAHGYSVQITGKKLPIVLSDSSSNYLFLCDYLNWPKWRIKFGYFLRRKIFGLLGLMDADTNVEEASKLIVFSKFAKKIHQKLGASKNKIEMIYPGLSTKYSKQSDPVSEEFYETGSDMINILFVGTWFERKGGQLLLGAFKKLSSKYPNARLTIVGEVPSHYSSSEGANATESRSKRRSSRFHSNNIHQYDYVPRERLMREFFPKADIFVLVPPKVEGYGFAVVEAMSFGIPVVVSNVCALPELVEDGKCGFVVKSGNVDDLYDKLEVLIKDPKLRLKIGEQAKKRFEEKFTSGVMNKKLLSVYKKALKS